MKLNKKIRSRSPYNEQIAVASDATRKVKQQQALYDVGFSIENTNKALRLCEGVSKADPNFQGEAFKMLSSAIDAIIRSPIDTTTVDAKQQAGKFCGELGDQVFHNDNLSTNEDLRKRLNLSRAPLPTVRAASVLHYATINELDFVDTKYEVEGTSTCANKMKYNTLPCIFVVRHTLPRSFMTEAILKQIADSDWNDDDKKGYRDNKTQECDNVMDTIDDYLTSFDARVFIPNNKDTYQTEIDAMVEEAGIPLHYIRLSSQPFLWAFRRYYCMQIIRNHYSS